MCSHVIGERKSKRKTEAFLSFIIERIGKSFVEEYTDVIMYADQLGLEADVMLYAEKLKGDKKGVLTWKEKMQ